MGGRRGDDEGVIDVFDFGNGHLVTFISREVWLKE